MNPLSMNPLSMNPLSMNPRIAIVGMGKMGSAMVSALKKRFPDAAFALCDKDSDLNKELQGSDVVIFSVKPQDFAACTGAITIDLSKKLILSIMAGVTLKSLKENLKAARIVRSMPNLPLQVGAGFTAWTCAPEVTEKSLVKEIFSCFGKEIEVTEESKLDKITALSGSGPAYFFYLCELLAQKAQEFGFTDKEAGDIAKSTFIGAARLLEKSDLSAALWRAAVSSKGGTTEVAINHLTQNHWDRIFKEAIEAAKKRSQELSQ